MKVDPQFLRQVQEAGWIVREVTDLHVIGACPRQNCSMSAKLIPGRKIPETCERGPDVSDIELENYDHGRQVLRERRLQLSMSIAETEEAAGISEHHLAKADKPNPSRTVQLNIFMEWAAALGFKVILRPTDLPLKTLRTIADTRNVAEARQRSRGRPAPSSTRR